MLHKTLQVKMWVLAIVVSIDLTFVLLNIPRCSEGGMKGELEKKSAWFLMLVHVHRYYTLSNRDWK